MILVRKETSPEDISGMHVAQGVLTARGGMTSHAAVVARGMGTPCVAGAQDIVVDVDQKVCFFRVSHFQKQKPIYSMSFVIYWSMNVCHDTGKI